MKYLKKFNEEFGWSVEEWCEGCDIKRYEIEDGLVNVDGDVNISNKGFEKIPIQFGKVTGNFSCGYNQLISLKGSPVEVGGYFHCVKAQLITLEGLSKVVSAIFCNLNKLTSLEGCPAKLYRHFDCSNNQLTSLEGGPMEVGQDYLCSGNQLTSLEGCPIEVGGYFYCASNPIYEVYELFGYLEKYKDSLDYKYLRGTNIVRGRFKKACEDADIKMPDSIPGYKYI